MTEALRGRHICFQAPGHEAPAFGSLAASAMSLGASALGGMLGWPGSSSIVPGRDRLLGSALPMNKRFSASPSLADRPLSVVFSTRPRGTFSSFIISRRCYRSVVLFGNCWPAIAAVGLPCCRLALGSLVGAAASPRRLPVYADPDPWCGRPSGSMIFASPY